MKMSMKICILAVSVILGLFCLAACGNKKVDVNANTPAGAAPVMPATHEGRFDSLGTNGCIGCHGDNGQGRTFLKQATALPADHYQDGNSKSQQLMADHTLCNTCHVQYK